MQMNIRPVRVPEDLGRLVEIYNAIQPEPITVEDWLEWEANVPEGRIREWVVATVDDAYVAGYAGADHTAFMNPGSFQCYSRVDPAYRNRGIGGALLQHVESWALAHGAALLTCMVRDCHEEAVAFAQKRGYKIDRHIFESTLDVPGFDESRFVGVIEQAEASGLRFLTLAEVNGEEIERKLYEAEKRTVLDIPGYDRRSFVPFEEWRRENRQGRGFRPDCFVIAMEGDAVAGFTHMHYIEQTGAMWTQYTCVHPDFRGRNLSLAMKLVTVRKAKAYGAAYMRTNNDSENAPMLAVNRKMGYVPCPGQYRVRKQRPAGVE